MGDGNALILRIDLAHLHLFRYLSLEGGLAAIALGFSSCDISSTIQLSPDDNSSAYKPIFQK